MKYVPIENLDRMGACSGELMETARLFPDGKIPWTMESAIMLNRSAVPVGWGLARLIPPAKRKEVAFRLIRLVMRSIGDMAYESFAHKNLSPFFDRVVNDATFTEFGHGIILTLEAVYRDLLNSSNGEQGECALTIGLVRRIGAMAYYYGRFLHTEVSGSGLAYEQVESLFNWALDTDFDRAVEIGLEYGDPAHFGG
jgi:hypothetical protein